MRVSSLRLEVRHQLTSFGGGMLAWLLTLWYQPQDCVFVHLCWSCGESIVRSANVVEEH